MLSWGFEQLCLFFKQELEKRLRLQTKAACAQLTNPGTRRSIPHSSTSVLSVSSLLPTFFPLPSFHLLTSLALLPFTLLPSRPLLIVLLTSALPHPSQWCPPRCSLMVPTMCLFVVKGEAIPGQCPLISFSVSGSRNDSPNHFDKICQGRPLVWEVVLIDQWAPSVGTTAH